MFTSIFHILFLLNCFRHSNEIRHSKWARGDPSIFYASFLFIIDINWLKSLKSLQSEHLSRIMSFWLERERKKRANKFVFDSVMCRAWLEKVIFQQDWDKAASTALFWSSCYWISKSKWETWTTGILMAGMCLTYDWCKWNDKFTKSNCHIYIQMQGQSLKWIARDLFFSIAHIRPRNLHVNFSHTKLQ